VRSSDGLWLGKVIRLQGERMVVERGRLFRTDWAIPVDDIVGSTAEEVRLRGREDDYLRGGRAAELTGPEDDLPEERSTSDADEPRRRSDGEPFGRPPAG
jgi:hypothetical protein